jgi:hypothetical protein
MARRPRIDPRLELPFVGILIDQNSCEIRVRKLPIPNAVGRNQELQSLRAFARATSGAFSNTLFIASFTASSDPLESPSAHLRASSVILYR